MSASSTYTIECDGLECDQILMTVYDDVIEARREAASRGWTYDENADEDYCSDHPEVL